MSSRILNGSIALPGSKSESNRVLMIAAYGGFTPEITNLSDAHDTVLLQRLLRQIGETKPGETCIVDGEDAGTVTRFLLTYMATTPGDWILTGSERMRQRPMKPLVDALRQLGADIEYQGTEGFLPLSIKGHRLKGGPVRLDASQSSQFVSSLLMASPYWEQGLQLSLDGPLASQPYVEMTKALMRHFGAPCHYQSRAYEVSADWSAASYWYELAALSEGCDLLLKGLKKDSLQGDRKVAEYYRQFGVDTRFEEGGARLIKSMKQDSAVNCNGLAKPLSFDLSDTPDLFPALFVTCVALGVSVTFHGVRNLTLKESDRVGAMIAELSKLYTFKAKDERDILSISPSQPNVDTSIQIILSAHADHRVVMALSPLKLFFPNLVFDHPEVVAKSYPTFWDQLQNLQ